MLIRNGAVFQEDGTFKKQDIFIKDHKIVDAYEDYGEIIDAAGLKIIPGLIDIHSHGVAGYDFSDGDVEGLKKILQYEKAQGITTWCPTSMSLPLEKLTQIFHSAVNITSNQKQASIGGINMEGPFLDAEKKGAHVLEYLEKPDLEFFQKCQESAGGMIKIVTVSPCSDEAKQFIEVLKDEVVLSLGHTKTDYEEAKAAFESGVSHVTHLYNAMNPINHREPGPILAAAEQEHVYVELICDGIHVHPAAVRSTFALFGRDRVVLISDSMRAAGMENGIYDLGGMEVYVQDGKATLSDGTLAGSAKNLFECMKMAIEIGVPEGDAILAATVNPAKSIGIYDKVGSITSGKEADLLVVDDNYKIYYIV